MMATIKAEEEDLVNAKKAIEAAFMGIGPADDPCAVSNLAIESNVANLQATDMGTMDADYDMGL